MNIPSKIIIIFVLMCISATAAYSQDCNGYLQRASELVSQKKYCDAKLYYQAYSKCNADADVNTEIAMCERFCKIRVMEGEETESLVLPERENNTSPERAPERPPERSPDRSFERSPDRYAEQLPIERIRSSSKLKLGLSGGLISTLKDGDKATFGGGLSLEFRGKPNIGIGLSAGYYAYQEESGGVKAIFFNMPITYSSRYYFLTKDFQPYLGADIGLYIFGGKAKYQGEGVSASKSYFGSAPVIGMQFKLSNTLAFDINSKYNIVFVKRETLYNFGFNAGLVFSF